MRGILNVFGMIVHSQRKEDGSKARQEKTKIDRDTDMCGRWEMEPYLPDSQRGEEIIALGFRGAGKRELDFRILSIH